MTHGGSSSIPISGGFGGGPPNTRRSTPIYISPAAVDNRAQATPSNTWDQRMLDFARRAGSGTTTRPPGDVAAGRVPGGFGVNRPPAFSPEAVRQPPAASVTDFSSSKFFSPELARVPSIRYNVTDSADRALINIAEAMGSGTAVPSIRGSITDSADRALMGIAEALGSGTVTPKPVVAAPSPYGANAQTFTTPAGPTQDELDAVKVWLDEGGPAGLPFGDAAPGVFPDGSGGYLDAPDGSPFGGGGGDDGGGGGGDDGGGDDGDPADIFIPEDDTTSPFDGVTGDTDTWTRNNLYLDFLRDKLGRSGERGFADIDRQFQLALRALPGQYNRRGMLDSGLYGRGKGLLGDSLSRASGRYMSDLGDQYFNLDLSQGTNDARYSNEGFQRLQGLAAALADKAANIGSVGFGALGR